MSVLHASTSDFLIALAQRAQPALLGKPFALLDEAEMVCAASSIAREMGVAAGIPVRQAQTFCPDLLFQPLNLAESATQQTAYLAEVTRWQLPVEVCDWGAIWIDLHTHTVDRDEVEKLAAELGGRLRRVMGADLTPRLGWDSSKFVSRVAAHAARAGAMRLVGKADEPRFLPPQPVSLLPLPIQTLQQLAWLGIRTLGAYAALPSTGVLQRWGKAGRLAQDWARGLDNRPIVDGLKQQPETIVVEFDPPTERIPRVLADVMQQMTPMLARMAQTLRGVRRMDVRCGFVTGSDQPLKITFVDSASEPQRLQDALAQHLGKMVWHDELERLEMRVVETGELSAEQLTLFAMDNDADADIATAVARDLAVRYGQIVHLGQVVESLHPAHEFIWKWRLL